MAAPASMRGLFLFFVASALAVCLLTISIRSFSSAPVVLFDVDGPSPRDPSRAQWAKGGHGTSYWMEQHRAKRASPRAAFWNHYVGDEYKHNAAQRQVVGPMGMHARVQAASPLTPDQQKQVKMLVAGAPDAVAKALDIPLGEVQAMASKAKSDLHSKQLHRQAAKQAGGAMLAEVKLEDMSECNGKAKKCDPLAENVVKVAEAIQEECFELYFQEREYYECVEKHGGPLCDQVGVDFPGMCQKYSYTTDHGYIGSEDPANTPGELCQACYQLKTSNCFGESETVVTPQGEKRLKELQAGDNVQVHADKEEFTRVIFVHAHPLPTALLTLELKGGASLSLTPAHPLPSSLGLTQARDVKAGAYLTLADGTQDEVVSVAHGVGHVRYFVLEEHRLPLVSGVVCLAESTPLAHAETLPFRLLHRMGLLELAPVTASLSLALESPLLSGTERLLECLFASLPPSLPPSSSSPLSLASPLSLGVSASF